MEAASTYLTQSKYFTPAFNAAIFDGPFRIYFAQYQEPLALKIYFKLQQQLKERMEKDNLNIENNIFVLLYPNAEVFDQSFAIPEAFVKSTEDLLMVEENFGDDLVVGVRGPIDENNYSGVYNRISRVFSKVSQLDFASV